MTQILDCQKNVLITLNHFCRLAEKNEKNLSLKDILSQLLQNFWAEDRD